MWLRKFFGHDDEVDEEEENSPDAVASNSATPAAAGRPDAAAARPSPTQAITPSEDVSLPAHAPQGLAAEPPLVESPAHDDGAGTAAVLPETPGAARTADEADTSDSASGAVAAATTGEPAATVIPSTEAPAAAARDGAFPADTPGGAPDAASGLVADAGVGAVASTPLADATADTPNAAMIGDAQGIGVAASSKAPARESAPPLAADALPDHAPALATEQVASVPASAPAPATLEPASTADTGSAGGAFAELPTNARAAAADEVSGVESQVPVAEPAPTGPAPLEESAGGDSGSAPAEAPSAEPSPVQALAVGTVVGDRFTIIGPVDSADGGSDEDHLYRATDTRSYEHCWSCGSTENSPSTKFCQSCGAPIQNHSVMLERTATETGAPDEVAYQGAYYHVRPERRKFGAQGIGVEVGAHSAEGPHHPNEDSYWYVTRTLCANSKRGSSAVLVLSDGMGGYAPGSGLISSRICTTVGAHVVGVLDAHAAQGNEVDAREIESTVREGIAAANTMVLHEIARTGEMGATLVVAVIVDDTAYLANIGDSRAYYVDPRGQATPVTRDQSLVEQQVQQGNLSASDVYSAPGNNIILHAIGETGVDRAADWYTQPLEPGSMLLLCTDGYWKTLRGAVMAVDAATGSPTLSDLARQMVDHALEQGSDDNTTVVLASVS